MTTLSRLLVVVNTAGAFSEDGTYPERIYDTAVFGAVTVTALIIDSSHS